MALQPGAPPTLSRRSSSSSIEVAFATPPTSPVLPPSVTRIPKPVHHTPSSHHLQQPSSSHPTDTPPPPPPPPPQTAAAPPVTTTTTPQAKPPVANGTPRSRSKSTPSASRIPFLSSGTLSTPATRRSVVISLASPESAGSNSSTPAQSRSGQATPRTPNVNLNGSTPPLDTINKVDPSPMVYTPALMTPWSAPVETNMKRNSQYIESGPPSAPPESANSWVVGAIPAESPQDMSPMTPLDGTFQTLKRTTEPEP
ncbi:uncharacterized protein EHS24_009546 [Apiotrichum porosum]|uniref:Uncharacterized protein n=1 Tax=Apiotrichum porosum TaxID=105984 RepID=A0A427XM38_9TREE|nr:uncharacterized protein EHS24_009546 [Apiotrichum porosum]RSH79883.1 hypothetical protein EHS24_009546 [Apiotrichum porosum]